MSADLSAAERRVLDAIDETELVATLVELVRTPSVTGTDADDTLYVNPHGNKTARDTVALTVTKAF